MTDEMPFERSARLYDLMYDGKDYAAAVDEIRTLVGDLLPRARDLLDVGCGTGRHLEHLGSHYRVEGLDLNPGLLKRAHERCPGVELHEADMTDFDLEREFDVVTCLFSAIGYARTLEGMRATIGRMAAHLRSPGLLIVEPWFTPATFWDEHVAANFHDEPEIKLAWMYRHQRKGRLSVFDIHHLVADADAGAVEHFIEHQELGLFTRDEMAAAFEDLGLETRYIESEVWNRGLYVARRS